MDKHVGRVFNAVFKSHIIRKATLFLSPKLTIKITRQHRDKRSSRHTYLLTVGKPNYKERQYLKKNKAIGQIQTQLYPLKKK